jgi:hypothetical protein
MTKINICLFILFVSNLVTAQFVVTAPGNDYTLTCNQPTITMLASPQTGFSYTWTNGGNPLYGNFINLSQGGTWTVTAQDATTFSISTQTFTIAQNFSIPTVAIVITPTVNNITCAGGSGCFTATCNGTNVTNWYTKASPFGDRIYQSVNCGTFNVMCAGSPGTYWFESVDPINGCAASKSVQVTASIGFPIFTATSPSNFSLGCGSSASVSIIVPTVITSPIPNGPVQYTFMSFPITATPTTFSSVNTLTNITTQGKYVVWVRDQNNNCTSCQTVCILQNTIVPNAYLTYDNTINTCKKPLTFLTGITNSPNTNIDWKIPINTLVNGPIVAVGNQTTYPNAFTQITALGVHTVIVTNTLTQCVGTETIHLVQDLRVPYFTITVSGNQSITCSNSSVILNANATPTLYVALGHTYNWQTTPTFTGSTYTTTSIVNTATAVSQTNGCSFINTFTVPVEYVLSLNDVTISTSCPVQTVNVSPNFHSGTSDLTFQWAGPAISGSANQSVVAGTSTGTYVCVVTNTSTNCSKTVSINVVCNTGSEKMNETKNSIKISPNPFSDQFLVNSSISDLTIDKITITNSLGQKVFEVNHLMVNEHVRPELQKGFYFIHIEVEHQVKTFKIIRE